MDKTQNGSFGSRALFYRLSGGDKIVSSASQLPHRLQRNRLLSDAKEPVPPTIAASKPFIVRNDPHDPRSIRRLNLNLTRSAAVLTCLVDIRRR
jgi:hypothetical protein